MGIREHTIFPEIDLDRVENVVGMSVTLVTNARSDEHGRALVRSLGVPLKSAAATKEAAA
jgi:large subunit ribosomal protein L5